MSYGRCQSPIYLPRLPGNLPAFSSYRTYLMFIGQLGKLTQGVATALYAAAHASRGATSAFTEASLTARPFFARQGFSVEQAQTVVRSAVTLQRFAMRKPLRP